MFNALDFLLILFLVVGAAWGLLRGAGRLLIGFFSLYVGLVVALLLYRPLGEYFRSLVPAMSIAGSQALAFVLLLLVFVNGFAFFTRFFSTPPEERKRSSRGAVGEAVTRGGRRFLTGPLSTILGLVVGLIVTVVWLSLILAVVQYLLRSGVGLGALRAQVDTSQLVPWFNVALARIYWSVSFWVPGDVPGLFANLLAQ
jgi:uncharacterized membrane protein required for colicin V production